ncbi:monocarboxylate transporter 3-like isoform X3 [Corticium candelabrum]|uniref:monocarboxylate transporter 3-like isoform X3 n=1 Tax=Corticium candelabrum TaxID=121492 RepID=UPI002E26308D|nr:monocarboxylate transporter 3-like isoform X3 [Corticium candelabrum]
MFMTITVFCMHVLSACVGSLSVSLVCFIGPIMNGLIEKFGPQRVLLVGTALVVAGFLLSSFSDSIWQLFLTYSVPVGVGCSFVWTTSLSLLPHYFERWLTVASSVAMTGRFLGMAIITPISRILMKSYGWRRMLQFFTLIGVPMCACAALFRPSAGSRRRKIDAMRRVGNCCKLQRNVRLTFYCWIGALQCTAITIPMTYIVEYAEETVEVDEEQSGFLLTAMAVTAAFSSIATGLIGLRIKPSHRLHDHTRSLFRLRVSSISCSTDVANDRCKRRMRRIRIAVLCNGLWVAWNGYRRRIARSSGQLYAWISSVWFYLCRSVRDSLSR